jgi:hypothetical protein
VSDARSCEGKGKPKQAEQQNQTLNYDTRIFCLFKMKDIQLQ